MRAHRHQIVLVASTILGSWLGMQAVHESGHVFGAWLSGGRIEKVVLHPLTISRTDLLDNPSPLPVVWAGPIVGVVAPLLAWAVAGRLRFAAAFVLRFFAGFCLVANGAYIGVGSFSRVGDAGEMLRRGSPVWLLWLFGAMTVPVGLWLWHGQGPNFGFGPAKREVRRDVVYGTLVCCALLIALGLAVGGK